jgi:sulfur carrier protein ThiS
MAPSSEDVGWLGDALCYHVLGLVHGCWGGQSKEAGLRHNGPVKMRDFIQSPKPNGYRSLHTTVGVRSRGLAAGVAASDGGAGAGALVPVEVQVRTADMHVEAEWGLASHSAYKADGSDDGSGGQSSAKAYDDAWDLLSFQTNKEKANGKGDAQKLASDAAAAAAAGSSSSDEGGADGDAEGDTDGGADGGMESVSFGGGSAFLVRKPRTNAEAAAAQFLAQRLRQKSAAVAGSAGTLGLAGQQSSERSDLSYASALEAAARELEQPRANSPDQPLMSSSRPPATVRDDRAYCAWLRDDLAEKRVFVFVSHDKGTEAVGATTILDLAAGATVADALRSHGSSHRLVRDNRGANRSDIEALATTADQTAQTGALSAAGVVDGMVASVNGRRVGADHVLRSGDTITVLTPRGSQGEAVVPAAPLSVQRGRRTGA